MRRVLIYGAGEAGEMVLQEIEKHPEERIEVYGFIDDDKAKVGCRIGAVRVLGGKEVLRGSIREYGINEVIIAMPSIEKPVIRDIVKICISERVKPLIVPSTWEIINGRVGFNQIRGIDPSDLIERESVKIDTERISGYIEGRTVLITGAAGSIGNRLVQKVLHYRPKKLIALDINESGLFYLIQGLGEKRVTVVPCVEDIKDDRMLRDVFCRYRPSVVFHTAAYKHVPLMENNIRMAFINNVGGTLNLLRLSMYYGVQRFVGISTDKAVYPVSVMGKTKRLCELIVEAYAFMGLKACSVRFGNVLGSNGSVLTVFQEQLRRGGPLTLTSPDMERYFMTLEEATSLVLQAGGLEDSGVTYVLDMGNPIRIKDLAESCIILYGHTPMEDIKILYTGVRAGEKLKEELFYHENDVSMSSCRGIFIEKEVFDPEKMLNGVVEIMDKVYDVSYKEIISRMEEIILSCSSRKKEEMEVTVSV
ncbi:MAG: polysaccharide biosynthesis protein [Spirochaetota bacterium]